jgi:hypothetical protein
LVYEQDWFKGDFITANDEQAKKILYEQCWKNNWAYIMENGTSPLLLGEWGGLTEGTDKLLELNKKYLRSIRDYIAANKYTLHHTFWCINNDSADTGGLLTRDAGTPFPGSRDFNWNDNKYNNDLLPVLWKDNNGKFIGLDHKVPLGTNGISLDQYYSQSPIKYGDLNSDDTVDALDFALLKSVLIKLNPEGVNMEAADVNLDNEVDALDFAVLKQYLVKQIKTLPYTG